MEMNKHGQSSSNTGGLNTCGTIPLYSKGEAEALAEKLRKKETFREAVQILITWLESGQCNESNSVQFHALIQLCWNYMEKLKKEQEEFLGEAQKAQDNLSNKKGCIQLQLIKFEDLFKVIENKNIWDIFTKNQIQEFQEMRRDIKDLKQNCSVGIKTEEESGEESENEISKLESELENKEASDASQNEMKIISLISCLLFDNPDGLYIDSIYSNLKESIPDTSAGEIEEVMRKYPNIFKESSPIVASDGKKWICISISQETMALLKKQ